VTESIATKLRVKALLIHKDSVCNSYTMARRDLPDIYAHALGPPSLRATGPRAYISGKSRLDMV